MINELCKGALDSVEEELRKHKFFLGSPLHIKTPVKPCFVGACCVAY
jgi:hypothetical protein